MRKYIGISLWVLLPSILWSQGNFVNNGAAIHVGSEAVLNISNGHVFNKKQSVIINQGKIIIGKDWQELDEETTYKGKGALWFVGNEEQVFRPSSQMKVANLGINTTANVRLENELIIGQNLHLKNGTINLGENNLVIQPDATIKTANATSYVRTNGIGMLKQMVGVSNVVFPIGNTHYAPAILSNKGVLDEYGVRVTTNHIHSNAVAQSWVITEALIGDSDLQLTLKWQAAKEQTDFDRAISGIANKGLKDPIFNAANSVGTNQWEQTRNQIKQLGRFSIVSNSTIIKNQSIEKPQVVLLPNPTDDKAWLKMNRSNEEGIVRIYAMDGKLLSEKSFVSDHLVPVEGAGILEPGGYWIQVLWEDGVSESLPLIKL